MNAQSDSRDGKQLAWPAAGLIAGALVATNPLYAPQMPLQAGAVAWLVAMAFVLILPAHPIAARAGAFTAGLFLAVPCFVRGAPLSRGLLMCCMFAPFIAAAALVVIPPISGFRARLGYLFSWGGAYQINRRTRSFDVASMVQLVGATAVLAAGLAVVISVSNSGPWLAVRWLAGGIMIIAFAEMATAGLPLVAAAFGVTVPPLMDSPYRSTSVSEFWTRRWNLFASQKVFRPWFFMPLARRGVASALFVTFALSGVGHALLAYMALANWWLSLMWGAFFLVQPLLIAVERRMNVRRWPRAAGRAWTLMGLAMTSPLFVEPALQIVERSWGRPDNALQPTVAALAFVLVVSGVISLGSLASAPTAQSDLSKGGGSGHLSPYGVDPS